MHFPSDVVANRDMELWAQKQDGKPILFDKTLEEAEIPGILRVEIGCSFKRMAVRIRHVKYDGYYPNAFFTLVTDGSYE